MSKHQQRRERRAAYYGMLDAEMSDEKWFMRRIIGTLDRHGLDVAPDGRPIRADFWDWIESRRPAMRHTALAGEHLMERAIQSLMPRRLV